MKNDLQQEFKAACEEITRSFTLKDALPYIAGSFIFFTIAYFCYSATLKSVVNGADFIMQNLCSLFSFGSFILGLLFIILLIMDINYTNERSRRFLAESN